jgi:hypothetical protein
MTCSEIESRLSAYLDDGLPPEERKRIEGHVAACPRCVMALADLKRTMGLLRDLEAVEPPPFFEQKIMARVREDAGRRRGILQKLFYPLHIKVPIQAMATILISVAAVYVYQTGGPDMRKTAPLPVPIVESGKGGIPAEPAKAPSNLSAAAPTGQAPAASVSEKVRDRSFAPSTEKAGEADRTAPTPVRDAHPPSAMPVHRNGQPEAGDSRPDVPETSRGAKVESGRPNLDHAPAVPAAGQKMKRKAATAGTATEKSDRTASSAVPLRSAVETTLDVTLRVDDAPAAAREIEAILGRFDAEIVERRDRKGSGFLRVDIAWRYVSAFMDRLEEIGRVDLQKYQTESTEGKVTVRINIVGNP